MKVVQVITTLELSRCGQDYFFNKTINGHDAVFGQPISAAEAQETYEKHRQEPIQRTIGIVDFGPDEDGQRPTYWGWRVVLEEHCEY